MLWKISAAVLLILLGACATEAIVEQAPAAQPVEESAVAQAAAAEQPVVGPPVPVADNVRLSIAAVGDMMLGTDYPENHLPDDDGVDFLASVTPWLSAAELAVGNLEGVLIDGGEAAKTCRNSSACYLFRSPTRYAKYFADAGFDAISVANNHARDFGEKGRTSSMQSLAAQGMYHSGRRGDFASFEVQGLQIAFLAFAVTRNSNLLHDYELAEQTVRSYAADHDVVIVSFHGGAEGQDVERIPFAEETYFGEPRGNVVRFSRSMVDAGADLIVGHGPHVVRGMELYKGRLIAYSLGNFATYYGISVEGNRGIAPILVTTVNSKGEFIDGQIHSTIQIRPGGPVPDPQQRALNLIRDLSHADFDDPGIRFLPDGQLLPQ
jgi:hypothetical protein